MLTRTSQLQRRTELRNRAPLARGPWRRASREFTTEPRPRLRMKSRGMKGSNVSAAQKLFWGRLVTHVGCIACRLDGRQNHECNIHHIDGRTKPGAHWLVLPLCAGHHQDGTGAPGLIAVHPWKSRFEERYGAQRDLLTQCLDRLYGSLRIVVPEVHAALAAHHSAGHVGEQVSR